MSSTENKTKTDQEIINEVLGDAPEAAGCEFADTLFSSIAPSGSAEEVAAAMGLEPPTPPAGEPEVLPEDAVPLHRFAEQAYLTYAMSTVLERALPFVEDGQKPVQRRILFAMRELGNRPDAPFKKSARIVGDVIGKYHPHGDSPVYEAAVRMAQNFTLRYPLIEGQGNFGSRDGDSPAAMRYTEVRLSRFAEEILLSEIDRGTVDFRENYDGTLKEPTLLPARLPMLLLNGVSGIAVGMATEIPAHNLREVTAACIAVIQGKAKTDSEIYTAIPGPDFPGGGQVISSPEDIRKAYESGRGSLRVRARWTVETLARGQYRIAITELPPNTNTAKVLGEIEELINPKLKTGKKTLTLEQQNLKANVLAVLDTFRDDSDKAHPVRIVLEPKTRSVAPDDVMNVLLANTSLESNAQLNMTMIGRDGRPQQKSLAQVVREWSDFRLTTVNRRLAYRFREVEQRIHILEGRLIALNHIEGVIKVVRDADTPRLELKIRFGLSEIQSDDILDIRLRQLARLETIKLEKELKELREEHAQLEHLLANETARRNLVVKEIRKDAEKYGDARRTLIEAAERITAAKVETVVDEAVTVILSQNGFIRSRVGHGIDPTSLTWKDGDGALAIVETRSIYPIVLLDTQGRAYTLRYAELPGGKGDGVPVTSLIELQTGAKIRYLLSAPTETRYLLASNHGYGFIGKLSDMAGRLKAGKAFVTLDEGAELLPPRVVQGQPNYIAALSSEYRLLVFVIEEMKELSNGGKGVILIALNEGETLLEAQAIGDSVKLQGLGRAGKVHVLDIHGEEFNAYLNKRARRGMVIPVKLKELQLQGT